MAKKKHKQYKLIAFDWSGTISDDRLPVYVANSRQSKDYGVPVEQYNSWRKNATMTVMQHFHKYNVPHTDDTIFADFQKHYLEIYSGGLVPIVYPDASEVLALLRSNGIVTAVLSAHEEEQVKAEAKMFGILDKFDLIVGSSRNKTTGLELVSQRLSISPSESLYIGDTIYDIRSAKAVPMDVGGITTGYHTKKALTAEKPKYIFQSLTEVTRLVV